MSVLSERERIQRRIQKASRRIKAGKEKRLEKGREGVVELVDETVIALRLLKRLVDLNDQAA